MNLTYLFVLITYLTESSNHSREFHLIAVLKKFSKVAGKHLWWSIFQVKITRLDIFKAIFSEFQMRLMRINAFPL